jgi:CII-binding regulator of phage lambda lysogenization HflD
MTPASAQLHHDSPTSSSISSNSGQSPTSRNHEDHENNLAQQRGETLYPHGHADAVDDTKVLLVPPIEKIAATTLTTVTAEVTDGDGTHNQSQHQDRSATNCADTNSGNASDSINASDSVNDSQREPALALSPSQNGNGTGVTMDSQMNTLFQAISLISKLAAMDSSTYANTAVASSITSASSTTATPTTTTNPNPVVQTKEEIQALLDQLQRQWRLEDTPIPSIIASIHRLQSNIGHLQNESTNTTDQLNITTMSLQRANLQNTKLKKACRKLYQYNQKIIDKLRKKRQDGRHFIKTVKDFLSKQKQQDLDTEEFIVACHEAMLKQKHQIRSQCSVTDLHSSSDTLTDDGHGDGSGHGTYRNRARTNTGESTFSDLDAYSYLGDYSIFEGDDTDHEHEHEHEHETSDQSYQHVPSHSTVDVDIGNLKDVGAIATKTITHAVTDTDTEELLDYDCGASLDSTVSSLSRSLVTDHAGATVRFLDRGVTRTLDGKKCAADKNKEKGDTVTAINTTILPLVSYKSHGQSYTLSFPRSQEIGLQFVQVPVASTLAQGNHAIMAMGNRNRAFSDSSVFLSKVDESEEVKMKVTSQRTTTVPTATAIEKATETATETETETIVTNAPPSPRIPNNLFGILGDTPERGILKSFSSPGSLSKKPKSVFTMENLFGITPKKSADVAVPILESMDNDADTDGSDSSTAQSAILVQDFQGFDTSTNVRPTVGARLIAINDQSLLQGSWTLEIVTNLLERQRATGERNHGIRLMFRNDPLDKLQKKSLEKSCIIDAKGGSGSGSCLDPIKAPEKLIRMPKIPQMSLPTSPKTNDKKSKPFFNVLKGKNNNEDDLTRANDKISKPFFNVSNPRTKDKKSKPFFNIGSNEDDDTISFFGITITKQLDKKSKACTSTIDSANRIRVENASLSSESVVSTAKSKN